MSEFKKVDNIYMLLPRFVLDPEVQYENDRYLPSIFRNFERNGMRFNFIIVPANIYHRHAGSRHYYPGEREELVESVLRELAVEENPNFSRKDSVLIFRFDYFLDCIAERSYGLYYSSDEIKLALEILAHTHYELSRGKTELSFYPIEELSHVTKDEEVYYCARFSHMFLGNNTIFDYCFGNENPNKFRPSN